MFKAAIVDYDICNMFSVKRALEFSGFNAVITQNPKTLFAADIVVLPGVGAFADAMRSLIKLDLVSPLNEIASSGKPFVGVCLGFQMLFSLSCEFGETKGLNYIPGVVRQFENKGQDRSFKVPHIGWNQVHFPDAADPGRSSSSFWAKTVLEGIPNGTDFYFVHSYYAIPEDDRACLAQTSYGPYTFCSAVQRQNIFGFQFHPERSGSNGIAVYKNIMKMVQLQKMHYAGRH